MFAFLTVVYHNPLTDAFFAVVAKLLANPPDKTLLVALEKRWVGGNSFMLTHFYPPFQHLLSERKYLQYKYKRLSFAGPDISCMKSNIK